MIRKIFFVIFKNECHTDLPKGQNGYPIYLVLPYCRKTGKVSFLSFFWFLIFISRINFLFINSLFKKSKVFIGFSYDTFCVSKCRHFQNSKCRMYSFYFLNKVKKKKVIQKIQIRNQKIRKERYFAKNVVINCLYSLVRVWNWNAS